MEILKVSVDRRNNGRTKLLTFRFEDLYKNINFLNFTVIKDFS